MPAPENPLPLIDPSGMKLGAEAPAIRAVEILDNSTAKIVLVVDEQGKLLGTVVDGDIRRGLIKGHTMDSPVKLFMHDKPYTLPLSTPRQRILEMMRTMSVRQIPLVNDAGEMVGLVAYDMLAGLRHPARKNPVVIMAGGMGKRLLPITSDIPKPMVELGGRPILEWILQRFAHYGFSEFYIAVNYLSHIIEDYFGNGDGLGFRITYLREPEFMGTAGALALLKTSPSEPIIVINGDILAGVDFAELVDYHVANQCMATVCARAHRVEVPYGVIQLQEGLLKAIVEKPVHEDLISAGIYILQPEALHYIAASGVTDMPAVLQSLVQDRHKVAVYPLRDDWVDVGRHDDLERAKRTLASPSPDERKVVLFPLQDEAKK